MDSIHSTILLQKQTRRLTRNIETMPRIYFFQAWLILSDEAAENSIYDSYAFRTYVNLEATSNKTLKRSNSVIPIKFNLDDKLLYMRNNYFDDECISIFHNKS